MVTLGSQFLYFRSTTTISAMCPTTMPELCFHSPAAPCISLCFARDVLVTERTAILKGPRHEKTSSTWRSISATPVNNSALSSCGGLMSRVFSFSTYWKGAWPHRMGGSAAATVCWPSMGMT